MVSKKILMVNVTALPLKYYFQDFVQLTASNVAPTWKLNLLTLPEIAFARQDLFKSLMNVSNVKEIHHLMKMN